MAKRGAVQNRGAAGGGWAADFEPHHDGPQSSEIIAKFYFWRGDLPYTRKLFLNFPLAKTQFRDGF